jgi:hypothetical protein
MKPADQVSSTFAIKQQPKMEHSSLGFQPVATENTASLVDISMRLLQEVSEIYGEEEAQQAFIILTHYSRRNTGTRVPMRKALPASHQLAPSSRTGQSGVLESH